MSTVLSTSKTSKPHAGALGPWWGVYRDCCTLLISLSVNKIFIFICKELFLVNLYFPYRLSK